MATFDAIECGQLKPTKRSLTYVVAIMKIDNSFLHKSCSVFVDFDDIEKRTCALNVLLLRRNFNLPVFTLPARLSQYTGSGTLRETAEPPKLQCAPPTLPACVVLVACPESNASHGDRSAALHVLILFYEKSPPPQGSCCSHSRLNFACAVTVGFKTP
jgi:hypothetical protein